MLKELDELINIAYSIHIRYNFIIYSIMSLNTVICGILRHVSSIKAEEKEVYFLNCRK